MSVATPRTNWVAFVKRGVPPPRLELTLASAFKRATLATLLRPRRSTIQTEKKGPPPLIKPCYDHQRPPLLTRRKGKGRPLGSPKGAARQGNYKKLAELKQRPLRGGVPTPFPNQELNIRDGWRRRSTRSNEMFKNEFELTPRELRASRNECVHIPNLARPG
ncbi:hypothetical protein GWK47_007866 [Chionoecetes opilio]|uniref:Uncharacterized protein n=1 Tax=Chionoecetes opilio TaxID=41210 RepID=A0A8J5C997_CHIOP|nr:hypothetical protein GWK47_007866 [Chionoecetes opilio]